MSRASGVMARWDRRGRPVCGLLLVVGCSGTGEELDTGATTTTSSSSSSAITTTTSTGECVATSTSAGTTHGYGATFGSLTDTTLETTTSTTTDATDFLVLGACTFAEPCEPYLYQAVEGGGDPSHESHLEIERCILENLRDGVPGRYRHTLTSPNTYGGAVVDSLFEVSADRRLTLVRYTNFGTSSATSVYFEEEYESALACVLAPPTYFDGCLDSHTSWGNSPDCLRHADGWWSECVPSGFSCPCDGGAATAPDEPAGAAARSWGSR